MDGAQPEHCTHHLLLHYHPTRLIMQATTQSGCKRKCKEQHQEIAAHAVMMRSVVGGPEAPLGAGCDDVSARAPRPGSAERGVAAASSESASRIILLSDGLFFRAYSYYNRTGGNDDDERHINSHTAVSDYCVRALHQRICHVRAKNHLGSRASGMQGSLDTGTAWPYYRPASRTLRFPGDEKLRR